MDNKEFYNNRQILSYNRDFMFCIGNRSSGKSFCWKCHCINNFLKTGKQFIYLRRYDNELDKVMTFFDDVMFKYPDVRFEVKGKEFYINDKLCGWAVPLSLAYKLKSVSFVNVDIIFFDEFLNETRRYLKNEVDLALNFYQTVARGGGKCIRNVKFVFVANAVSIYNPYFSQLNIVPKNKYTKGKGYVVELFVNEKVNDEIKNSQFFDIIKDSKYGQYAMNNDFYLDSNSFVQKVNLKDGKYLCTLKYENQDIACYTFDDFIYVSSKVNKQYPIRYAFTTQDHDINYIMLYKNKKSKILDTLRVAFQKGQMKFETMKIKYTMFTLMNIIE